MRKGESAFGVERGDCPPPGREPSALQQIRESAGQLLTDGKVDEACDYLFAALAAVLQKNGELELLLAKMRRERVGKRTERIDPRQLSLMLEQLARLEGQPAETTVDLEGESQADTDLSHEIDEAKKEDFASKKKKKGKQGRVKTRGARREVLRVAVPEEERTCRTCGKQMPVIGEDVSRVLEYVPGHFIEVAYQLEKCACGSCKDGVTTAAGPDKVIERSPAGASLLAHVVVSKYVDHCPLHRLRRIYRRSGATIAVSTLSDWVASVADLTQPLVDKLAERVLEAHVTATDATGLKVLDPNSPENIARGTIWCYVGDDRDVLFRYTPTGEGATGPWEFLAGRTGYIQADAASVFDRLYNGRVASAIELGCWSHGRRRLEALKDTDCRVAYPLLLISRLYRIETLADVRKLEPDDRAVLRQERSSVVLKKLKRWLLGTLVNDPPSSQLAQAIRYIINQWDALGRFVEDGRLSLDNNLCERQIRDIALGRRNYLFAGSHDAARRTATLYSLMRTCAQYGVAPLPYLTDVLQKLAGGWKANRLDELLPDRWQALHATA